MRKGSKRLLCHSLIHVPFSYNWSPFVLWYFLFCFYHESDFEIPAAWTLSAIAHGKGPVDGIGAALKYRATRRVLSVRREDAILTPQELYQFAWTDTKINVFYLSRQDIKQNSESMNLSKRLTQKAVKGQIILSAIDKRFPSFFDRLDSRNSQFSSIRSFGIEPHQLS